MIFMNLGVGDMGIMVSDLYDSLEKPSLGDTNLPSLTSTLQGETFLFSEF